MYMYTVGCDETNKCAIGTTVQNNTQPTCVHGTLHAASFWDQQRIVLRLELKGKASLTVGRPIQPAKHSQGYTYCKRYSTGTCTCCRCHTSF